MVDMTIKTFCLLLLSATGINDSIIIGFCYLLLLARTGLYANLITCYNIIFKAIYTLIKLLVYL